MSVLQDMTKDIMTTKATKASKLTPVAGESGMTVAAVAATLPNDVGVFMSNEALIDHAKALRKFAADAVTIADGLDAMAASNTLPPSAPQVDEKAAKAAAKKAAEQEGDRKAAASGTGPAVHDNGEFAARLARLQQEAQASVFTAADDGAEEPVAAKTDGWSCPEHGPDFLTTINPRKGDPYLMCDVPDCEQYEKR